MALALRLCERMQSNLMTVKEAETPLPSRMNPPKYIDINTIFTPYFVDIQVVFTYIIIINFKIGLIMKRSVMPFLLGWLHSTSRKPLVVRGARQVGKTWLVRHVAKVNNLQLIELNFEKNPEYKQYFINNDPHVVLRYLEAAFQCTFDPQKSLLFLDEIQAAPELISKLRWFFEDLPQLPVIAAGSLLEFTLANYPFSMPVGRIEYLHLEPLSFEEFLLALEKDKLYDFLNSLDFTELQHLPQPMHEQLMMLFKDYLLVGGLPAAVASWIEHKSLEKIGYIHHNLMATYRDDFHKYSGKLNISRLEDVLIAIPNLLGKKFIYSHVNKDVQSAPLKQALDLLTKAKLCSKVSACAANGIPIGSEPKKNHFKMILLDIGLANNLSTLRITFSNFSYAIIQAPVFL